MMGMFGRGLSCCLLAFLFSHTCWARPEYTHAYDSSIHSAADKWWPELPEWLLWKSQLLAESRLDPNAKSSVGAEGLAQFMPQTWIDVVRALKFPRDVSPRDAGYAIEGGAYYMATLRHQWRSERPQIERHWLAVSSYNRGTANVLRDQKECNGALLWADIEPCTAMHTMETPNYVRHIRQYWNELQH